MREEELIPVAWIGRIDWRGLLRLGGIAAVLIGLPPLLGSVWPGVFNQFRGLMLGVGVTYALAALSLNVLMGYAGQISLGHAGFFGLGAFASSVVTERYRLAMIFGMLVAAAAGGLAAFLVGLPSLRIRGLYLAISTLAFGVAMQIFVFRIGFLTGGSAGASLPRPRFGETELLGNFDYLGMLLGILLLVWLLDRNVTRSKIGRAFFAIRSNEEVASSFGVNVAGYKLLAFTISGALAGLAGSLFGHLIGFVQAESFEFDISLLFVVMVVVGGLGSRWGVLVAGVFFAILPRLLTAFEGWDLIIGSALLIYTIARNPGGLAGAVREARERRGRKEARRETDEAGDEEPVIPRFVDVSTNGGISSRPDDVLPGDPLLRLEDVAVRFGGLDALGGVSLEIPKGAIVGLIGPNGAGKSTLFNVISGFTWPDRGKVLYRKRDIVWEPPHRRARLGIGRTFQNVGLVADESVLDNFLLAQHVALRYDVPDGLLYDGIARRSDDRARTRAVRAIEALGLSDLAHLPAGSLSGGQQRIVEMGCALITNPDMLLLDEPSAGMAPAAAESLAQRLLGVRDELGKTILLIEHHIPMVLAVCDYVYVLHLGRILTEGKPSEIVKDAEVARAYLGEAAA
ncbi:MAG: ABC transporter permease subunit [Actinomycetota bacterium]